MNTTLLDLPLPIQTPRLLLRAPQIGDGVAVNAAILESFDVLHTFMPWAKEKPSIDESEQFVREAAANWIVKKNEEPWLSIFIFDKTNGQFIGATGYHNIDWDVPRLEIGYWIRSSYSHHGFMTEAVNALTQYAFKQLHVKRIAITCDVDNERSKKIPERLGFCLEGTLKFNRLKTDGTTSDTLIFARYNLDDLPNIIVTW